MSDRTKKVANKIKEFAANFLSKENNRTSLITITDAKISSDLKRTTIFFTVLPEKKEGAVLDFLKRKAKEFRQVLKENLPIKNIPFVEFAIDEGEKKRQKIDELLRNS